MCEGWEGSAVCSGASDVYIMDISEHLSLVRQRTGRCLLLAGAMSAPGTHQGMHRCDQMPLEQLPILSGLPFSTNYPSAHVIILKRESKCVLRTI